MRGLLSSPAVPPGLSTRECGTVGSASCRTACPIAPQSTTSLGLPAFALPRVLSARLPISAPPTGLDECFFFTSLVVGLPYSLIFCQFWLFLVFKLLLSFFWLCKEAQCVYLCLHLGRKSQTYTFKERGHFALTHLARLVEHHPAKQKVEVGWIPCEGTSLA